MSTKPGPSVLHIALGEEVRQAVREVLDELKPELVAAVKAAASDRLVTVEEAARILGISVEAMRKRVARGQLKVVRVGRSIRVRVADIT